MLLTPRGAGAIAALRLVGPATLPFLAVHFSKAPKVGRCVHGTLGEGDRIIDDPVVVLLPDGAGADINLHGGPWVVQSAMDLAQRNGFVIRQPPSAVPGERTSGARDQLGALFGFVELARFEANAPQAGPLNLETPHRAGATEIADDDLDDPMLEGATCLEREIESHLPWARTELAIRVLLGQTAAWERFRSSRLRASEMVAILQDASLWHLLHPPTVAIIGAPNVGKSTLANQLFGQERSITADMAGTTRDWVGEIANIDGLPVLLVDTPGQRQTHDAIEQAAIERSRPRIESSQLIVLILDASRSLAPEQAAILHAYPSAMRVANKCDRPCAWEVGNYCTLRTVASTGAGVDELRRAIARHFGCAEQEITPFRSIGRDGGRAVSATFCCARSSDRKRCSNCEYLKAIELAYVAIEARQVNCRGLSRVSRQTFSSPRISIAR